MIWTQAAETAQADPVETMQNDSDRRPSADGLAAAAAAPAAAKQGGLPPVHLWNPPFCGDLDMRIARDGTWFYLGTPIGREALVRLFSSILKREDGKFYLVTPVEKVGIRVQDAPFLATDFRVEGAGRDQVLTFVTSVEDEATAGPELPIRVKRDPATGEPSPYVLIRDGMEATGCTFVGALDAAEYDGCTSRICRDGKVIGLAVDDGASEAVSDARMEKWIAAVGF